MRDMPELAPSAPTKVEKLRAQLWNSPAPVTRKEYLARKDIRHEIDVLEKDEYRKLHKPGYENLMKVRGKARGEI